MIHLGGVFGALWGENPTSTSARQKQTTSSLWIEEKPADPRTEQKKPHGGEQNPGCACIESHFCFLIWLVQIHRRRIWFNIKPASRAAGAEVALARKRSLCQRCSIMEKIIITIILLNVGITIIQTILFDAFILSLSKKNYFALMQCYNIPNLTFC